MGSLHVPCSCRKIVDDELHVAHSKIYILHACIAIFIGTPCEDLLKYIVITGAFVLDAAQRTHDEKMFHPVIVISIKLLSLHMAFFFCQWYATRAWWQTIHAGRQKQTKTSATFTPCNGSSNVTVTWTLTSHATRGNPMNNFIFPKLATSPVNPTNHPMLSMFIHSNMGITTTRIGLQHTRGPSELSKFCSEMTFFSYDFTWF